jgi:hypothetical protein
VLVTAEEKERVIAEVAKFIRKAERIELRISRDVAREEKPGGGIDLKAGPWTLILEASEVTKAEKDEWSRQNKESIVKVALSEVRPS